MPQLVLALGLLWFKEPRVERLYSVVAIGGVVGRWFWDPLKLQVPGFVHAFVQVLHHIVGGRSNYLSLEHCI